MHNIIIYVVIPRRLHAYVQTITECICKHKYPKFIKELSILQIIVSNHKLNLYMY